MIPSPVSRGLRQKNTVFGGTCLIILLLLTTPLRSAEANYVRYTFAGPSANELKAIYLYNFLMFVTWPKGSCRMHETRSHQIAVLGDSPFREVLVELQSQLRQKGKILELSFHGPYRNGMELPDCCLLFIAESEERNLAKILEQLSGKAVLTVADTDAFLTGGVMITLVEQQNRIRWAVNRKPVKASGLRLSAKLLDIAVQVIDEDI